MGDEGLFGNTSKGPVHTAIDAWVNYHDQGVYVLRQAFLDALNDEAQDYVDILSNDDAQWKQPYRKIFDTLPKVSEGQAEYLRNFWYNTRTGWWHDRQPIQPIIRQGLIKAIELAMERKLPLDSYWVTMGDIPQAGQYFHVIITCSPQQVTRLILTPLSDPPDQDHLARLTQPADIWVVKRRSTTDHEKAVEESFEEQDEKGKKEPGPVRETIVMRLKERPHGT